MQSPPCPPASADDIAAAGSDLVRAQINACLTRFARLGAVLKMYTDAAQQRNVQLEKLNALVGVLDRAQALFPPDAKATDALSGTVKGKGGWDGDAKNVALEKEINGAFIDAGFAHPELTPGSSGRTGMQKDGQPVVLPGGLSGVTTKGELEAMLAKVKGKIDSTGNSQQLELVQLQSLMSKRDESLTMATNLQKRNEDGIRAILRNIL
jgi:hypothetical protein